MKDLVAAGAVEADAVDVAELVSKLALPAAQHHRRDGLLPPVLQVHLPTPLRVSWESLTI